MNHYGHRLLALALGLSALAVAGVVVFLWFVSAPTVLAVAPQETPEPGVVLALGQWQIPTPAGHVTVLVALGGAALSIPALVAWRRQRKTSADSIAGFRHRWGSRIVVAGPHEPGSASPVVDVPALADLGRVAERYDLMILDLSQGELKTFVVQDGGTAYRFRVAAPAVREARGAADRHHSGTLSSGSRVRPLSCSP